MKALNPSFGLLLNLAYRPAEDTIRFPSAREELGYAIRSGQLSCRHQEGCPARERASLALQPLWKLIPSPAASQGSTPKTAATFPALVIARPRFRKLALYRRTGDNFAPVSRYVLGSYWVGAAAAAAAAATAAA